MKKIYLSYGSCELLDIFQTLEVFEKVSENLSEAFIFLCCSVILSSLGIIHVYKRLGRVV